MCGFLGQIGEISISEDQFRSILSKSHHRGPDHAGVHRQDGCMVGFNRLSIQDLSPLGHQPMVSSDERRILLFNGEIYNNLQLRESFGLKDFKGHGDTETLFRLFNQEGICSTVKHLDGMFAIAWVDLLEGRFYLARDRAGIKPLYYYQGSEGVIFSSQLDQILHFPVQELHELSGENVYDYFSLGYMIAPNTIFKHINQVEPGQIVVFDLRERKIISKHCYYRFERKSSVGKQDEDDVIAQSIERSVTEQMVADVPVTTFMSGGVDSPIINAYAIKHKPDLRAFTFKNLFDNALDESSVANALSASIGLDYENVVYRQDDVVNLVNEHFAGMHEPLGDFSTIPTFLICRALKEKATVVLSGDGGDELFFGYSRHLRFLKYPWLFRLPLRFRRPMAKLLMKLSGEKISYSIRSHEDAGSAYRDTQASISRKDLTTMLGTLDHSAACNRVFSVNQPGSRDFVEQISKADYYGFMQRVLRKVDMMSMINSVEVRVPYLCNSLIDKASHYIPRIRKEQDLKAPLKRIFDKCYPGLKPFRRKIGFTLPIEQLMKGPLKEDILQQTCDTPIFGDELINTEAVRTYIRKYFDGKHKHHQGVWHIYVWQKWANKLNLKNK